MVPFCYALVVYFLHFVGGYKTGPPVDLHPDICVSMFPHGHDAEAQTSSPPFEISVADSCFNDKAISVTLSARNDKFWFEGFFVQARSVRDERNYTYGVFGTNNDRQLQVLQCSNSPAPGSNNSLGHSEAKKYYHKTFTWTPPRTGIRGGIQFVATVVHETPDFWLNVRSPIVATHCTATALIPTSGYIIAAFVAARLANLLKDE